MSFEIPLYKIRQFPTYPIEKRLHEFSPKDAQEISFIASQSRCFLMETNWTRRYLIEKHWPTLLAGFLGGCLFTFLLHFFFFS